METARILLHVLFVLVGVATTMIGPLLPTLLRRWDLSDSQAGALFTAQFLLLVFSSVAVSWLLRYFRAWHLMSVGFVLCGVGALGFAAPTASFGFAGACLLGLGVGMVNPNANLAAASLRPKNPAAALNLLNFFFSAGAMAAPLVIGVFLNRGIAPWFPVMIAVLTLVGAAIASRLFVADYESVERLTRVDTIQELAPRRMPFAVLTMLMLFVYVGIEVSMGGWTPSYLIRATGTSAPIAATAPSAFWGAILASRLLTVILLPRLGVLRILAVGICITVAGTLWMLLVPSANSVFFAIALTGLGMGPIFPNAVGYFLEHYGKGSDRLTGVLFAAGGVGGSVLPLVIGNLSDSTGNLEFALWTIPANAVAMLLAFIFVVRRRPGLPNVAPVPKAA